MTFKWPKIGTEVEISFSSYPGDGGIAAAVIVKASGERYAYATVNLRQPPASLTDYREIVLKNWRENEGIEDAMLEAGIIEGAPTRWIASAPVYRLTDRASAQAQAEIERAPATLLNTEINADALSPAP
jgi:hypothetical protein